VVQRELGLGARGAARAAEEHVARVAAVEEPQLLDRADVLREVVDTRRKLRHRHARFRRLVVVESRRRDPSAVGGVEETVAGVEEDELPDALLAFELVPRGLERVDEGVVVAVLDSHNLVVREAEIVEQELVHRVAVVIRRAERGEVPRFRVVVAGEDDGEAADDEFGELAARLRRDLHPARRRRNRFRRPRRTIGFREDFL